MTSSSCRHVNRLWEEKRKARPVDLPLGTGKASGAWTQNFFRQLPCSKQARAESCDQHGRKSTKSIKSIDKTAKSIGAFDSINYGVYDTLPWGYRNQAPSVKRRPNCVWECHKWLCWYLKLNLKTKDCVDRGLCCILLKLLPFLCHFRYLCQNMVAITTSPSSLLAFKNIICELLDP